MVENVIVTLVFEEQEFDMELPAGIEVSRLKPLLCEAMRRKGLYLTEEFELEGGGGLLKKTDTLYGAGVWDGSFLKIVRKGQDEAFI